MADNNITKLENLINPEVMADMINEAITAKIKTLPYAKLDDTLEGTEGDTIDYPSFKYIGDAVDVAEGEEIPIRRLVAVSNKFTVKMAGAGIVLTDKAVLAGHGDPVGNANQQLAKAIRAKVDNDAVDALLGASTSYVASTNISYDAIIDAIDLFEDEETLEKVIWVHPKQVTQLRKDPDFLSADKYGSNVMVTGEIGMIANCRVVPSRKVKYFEKYYTPDTSGALTIVASGGDNSATVDLAVVTPSLPNAKVGDKVNLTSTAVYFNPIAKIESDSETDTEAPALTYILKRDTNVETDRLSRKRSTEITADQIYTVGLTNDSKVVILKAKATPSV